MRTDLRLIEMQTSLQGHIIHIACWYFQTQYSLFYILGNAKNSSITCLIVWRQHSGLRSVERMPSVQGQPAGCFHTPPFFLPTRMKSHWRSTDGEIIRWGDDGSDRIPFLLEQREHCLSLVSIHKLKSHLWPICYMILSFFHISGL